MNAFNSCDGTSNFIRCEMKCSIQLGFASLNRTFHLSPHENICTIALITIHYLYNIHFVNNFVSLQNIDLDKGYILMQFSRVLLFLCT